MNLRLAKVITIVAALVLAVTTRMVRADDGERTPISREHILATLHSSGMGIEPGQMEQLSGVTAAEPNPPLRVVSVDMLDGESDKVLLRCAHPGAGLPFYVVVHWGHSGGASAAWPARPGESPLRSSVPAQDLLVRSGKFVVLLLDGNYIHMTLPVLCLQNGGRGQQVRVINKATKKRYLARVTGPGVVTSVLSE